MNEHTAENGLSEHPHVVAVREYLDNAGITPEALRYAATHEALCKSWIFDLLTGLADVMEAENRPIPPVDPDDLCLTCGATNGVCRCPIPPGSGDSGGAER